MKTETKFPIVFGTVVEVTCDSSYKLEGSYTVTCDRDTTFTFVEQSACIQLGKLFRHCVYYLLSLVVAYINKTQNCNSHSLL